MIIIGAGAGGLATASLLAKAGKKVLVLEQHDQGLCRLVVELFFGLPLSDCTVI